jgi:hypothetical protein
MHAPANIWVASAVERAARAETLLMLRPSYLNKGCYKNAAGSMICLQHVRAHAVERAVVFREGEGVVGADHEMRAGGSNAEDCAVDDAAHVPAAARARFNTTG